MKNQLPSKIAIEFLYLCFCIINFEPACVDLCNHDKIVVGCFDGMLVGTIGVIHLLELKEATLYIIFYNIFII